MDELFSNYIKTRNIKSSTVLVYKRVLVNLHKRINGNHTYKSSGISYHKLFTELNPNLDWCKDTVAIIELLKPLAPNSQKTFYSILSPLFIFIGKPEIGLIYKLQISELGSKLENIKVKQTITKPHLQKAWVPFKTMQEKYFKYIEKVGNGGLGISSSCKTNTPFIAVSFMLLFCPRRPSALEHMKVIIEKPFPQISDLSIDYNYLLVTKTGKSSSLIMNNFKTNKHIGQQIFTDLDPSLAVIIYNFVSTREKAVGSETDSSPFLLQKTVGNKISNLPYSNAGISMLIKKFMTEELKIPNITCTDIRTIYITDFYNEKVRYIDDINKEAYKLGNGSSEFTKSYVKRSSEFNSLK